MDPRLSLGPGLLSVAGERVLEALDGIRPVVYLGAGLGERAAPAAVTLAAILVRLFPHVTIEGDARLGPNPWGKDTVQAAVEYLARAGPTATRSPDRDVPIGVGAPAHDVVLGMGGNDWTAYLGPGPQPVAGESTGLGLQAAAALLAAEIAKQVLGPLGLPRCPLVGSLAWNLLDYRLAPAPATGSLTAAPLRLALFGAGSVGSSVACVLACMPELAGTIDIVDGDTFDPHKNSYRYPAATGAESGPKAAWLGGMLGRMGWQARTFDGFVAEWVAAQPDPGFDGIAISSVDGVAGRLQVADVLARTTLSTGVSGLALHLQRESLGDGFACPYCDFVDVTPPLGQAQAWAQQSGLSVERVTELLIGEGRLRAEDVQAAVRAGRLRPERVPSLIGRRLVDLIGRVYAEAVVNVGGKAPAVVSAPYVSWMGGVLAVAEIAKAAYGLPLINRRFDLDMSGLPGGFTLRRSADTSGRCACVSPVRRRWMRRLYAEE